MKKIIYNALLSISLLIAPVMTASALDYTIKQGGATETVTYTTWSDFVAKICTYTGTADNAVEVEISKLSLSESNWGSRKIGSHPAFLYAGEEFSYTTITLSDCDLHFPTAGLRFEGSRKMGNKIRFVSCSFEKYSIYGIEGEGSTYSYDFDFIDCEFNGTGIGHGGCWYGDVNIVGCYIDGMINLNCGCGMYVSSSMYKNSKGEDSTLSLQNCSFSESPALGLYGASYKFYNHVAPSGSPFVLFYKSSGWWKEGGFEKVFLDESGNYTYEYDGKYNSVYIASGSLVSYNANGGQGTMTDPTLYRPDESIVTIMANKFTNPGYAFVKWNTSADGTGTDYTPGQTTTIPFGNHLNLYAQWEEAKGPSILDIQVTGLAKGESEVFGVYSVAEGGAETLVMNVVVTGNGTGVDVSTVTALPAGTYSVKPASWAWAYTNSSAAQSVTVSDGTTSTAEFTLTAKAGQPSHGEKARVNEFK